MICSASQIDSFWKTLVLSKDWESSMRAIVIEPPRLGVSDFVVAGDPPLDLELSSPDELPQPATAMTMATPSSGTALFTRMSPSSGRTAGGDAAHCVQHTPSDVTPGRPVAGPRRPGGPQAALADGRRLARPADHQRRERARRAADRAAARGAGRRQPLPGARGAAHPGQRGPGGADAAPRRACGPCRGAGRARALRVPAPAR